MLFATSIACSCCGLVLRRTIFPLSCSSNCQLLILTYCTPCLGNWEHNSIEITDSLFMVCVQGTPQDGSRLVGRLAASSTALSKQAFTPAVPQTPDQMRQLFFMSATPLGEQQERAMRQVLQEQVLMLIIPNQPS